MRLEDRSPTATRDEPESPPEGGPAATLWLLAALIAEVEFAVWFFSRIYGL